MVTGQVKKIIALLLVHVYIPHFKGKEDIYSTKKLTGKSKLANCGEKRLNMKIDSEIEIREKTKNGHRSNHKVMIPFH